MLKRIMAPSHVAQCLQSVELRVYCIL